MKNKLLGIILIGSILTYCQAKEDNVASRQEADKISADSKAVNVKSENKFECNYMNEKPPGDLPVKFAPGVVSTNIDDSIFEISITGKEMVFNRDNKIYLTSLESNGKWTPPAPIFEGGEPSFSRDGRIIYFNTRGSFPGSKVALNVWYSEKVNGSWAEPNHFTGTVLDQVVHAPSIAANGNMYSSGVNLLQNKNGEYQKSVKLNPPLKGSHPFIASDESYIIFDKRPPNGGYAPDLYISFKKVNGTWSEAVWLGDKINSKYGETNAFVTPDGKYLFFSRNTGNYDIYWVNASLIETLKTDVLKK